MKDIFNRYNYIIEEDDNEDTDFTSSTLDTTSNNDSDEEDNDTEEQTSNDSDETEDTDTDFTLDNDNINDDNNGNDDNDDDNSAESEGGQEGSTDDNATDDEESNDDNENVDNEGDSGSEDDLQNDEPVDIIAKEKELYDNLLSSNDIATRNEELKRSFNEMYDFITKLISIIVDVKKSNVNLKTLEYCEERLLELKNMSYDYIVYNFSQNSYIQNQIRYKKTLFTISKIIDLMNKISHKKEDN